MEWFFLPGGAVLLYLGANWLVMGASRLALALNVSPLVVGLTVVAYGTSTPEAVVGIQAALGGFRDIALGNVVGSNIANIGLILGLSALVYPAKVNPSLGRREVPALLVTALMVPIVLVDGEISLFEGSCLVLGAGVHTFWAVRTSRRSVTSLEGPMESRPRDHGSRIFRSAFTAAAGLGTLLAGSYFFLKGAVFAAHKIGLSERFVGLTIVAVGTSLPELVTSVVAAFQKRSDIAIGNIVGSNIFNILFCLGTASLAGRVGADLKTVWPDLVMLVCITSILAFMLRKRRRISRWEGAFLCLLYVMYAGFLVGAE